MTSHLVSRHLARDKYPPKWAFGIDCHTSRLLPRHGLGRGLLRSNLHPDPTDGALARVAAQGGVVGYCL